MALVVQKYGGSSVADADGIKRVAQRIVARRKGGDWAVVVVPRLLSRLIKPGEFPLGKKVWGADHLLLKQADSDFAAAVIAAWAGRYLGRAD